MIENPTTMLDEIKKEIDDGQLLSQEEQDNNKIDSVEEIIMKLESQFENNVEVEGLDKTDYFKIFCNKFLNVPLDKIDEEVDQYINDSNDEIYTLVLNHFAYHFHNAFGVKFSEDSNYVTMYKLYKVLIINPDITIVNYLIYNHYYVEKYEFKTFYNQAYKTSFLSLLDIFKEDSSDSIEDVLVKGKDIIENVKEIKLSYQKRYDAFNSYAIAIFSELTGYEVEKFESFFENLYRSSNITLFDDLDSDFNVLFRFRVEDPDIFVDKFIRRIFNNHPYQEIFINNMIDEFFKTIYETERKLVDIKIN
jgi:hypothetical protein